MLPRNGNWSMRTFAQAFSEQLAKKQDKVIEALFTAAIAGDSRILVDLVNRVLGRPTQSIELSGPGGTPLRLQAVTQAALAQLSPSDLDALDRLQARLTPAALPPAPSLPDVIVTAQPEPVLVSRD